MTDKKSLKKAIDILEKMNNRPITSVDWLLATEYAKSDLKRKALIVVEEVIAEVKSNWFSPEFTGGQLQLEYWEEVLEGIRNFEI